MSTTPLELILIRHMIAASRAVVKAGRYGGDEERASLLALADLASEHFGPAPEPEAPATVVQMHGSVVLDGASTGEAA